MKIITQISLFDDTQNENLGDLERLKLVLDNLPDKPLIQKLKSIRGKGRNEWPVEAMWNSLVASFIFDHDSVAGLLRELNRNSQLRIICGFQPHLYTVLAKEKDEYGRRTREQKYKLAPTPSAYTNFLNNLRKCGDELQEMFGSLVGYMYENLAGFGEILAADGKAIQSYATKISQKDSGNRGEKDADWCRKTYTTTKPDGEKITKTKKWFGFRLHLISDAVYELPVDFEVTKASSSELKETGKLLEEMKESRQEKLEKCRYFLADRGYDSTGLIEWLETEGVCPVIDIRNCWQGEETRQSGNTDLIYDYKGKVYFVPEKGEPIELQCRGYDKSRGCQRYGFHPKYHDKRIFRIPLKTGPRIFTRAARNTRKWKKLYNKRTSIERINGKIDRDF
ncbi:MAG: transposase [Lachnospiraceae bacterium]|nr:transposase [Lachnospiraceae bacterium]